MTERAPDIGEIRVLNLFAILLRSWKLIAAITLIGVLAATVLVFVRAKVYATAITLIPASSPTPDNASLSALAKIPLGLGGLASDAARTQQLVGVVLQSRTLADSIVARIAGPTPEPEREGEIRKLLKQQVEVVTGDAGSVKIGVEGEDPELITRIANLIPQLVNEVMTELSTQAAMRREQFLETQLARAHERLSASEQRMLTFQQSEQAPAVQQQAERTLDVAAQLQQKILARELEIAQMRRTVTASNPELQSALAELAGMRSQLEHLAEGQGTSSPVLHSFRESAALKVTATRLLRDYNRDEQIYLSLTSSLADAQVDASNNMPVLTVLDEAIVPLRPSGWPAFLLIGLAGFAALLLGCAVSLTREAFRHARGDIGNASFFTAWEELKRDLFRRRSARRTTAIQRADGDGRAL
jgi:capsular polysaccharide biosynthesis protein